jgi:hypothetical protein
MSGCPWPISTAPAEENTSGWRAAQHTSSYPEM